MSKYRLKNSNKKSNDDKQIFQSNNRDSIDKQKSQEISLIYEQILDQEFRSLDIDADGYLSITDLQSVLKNFSHLRDSNEIISRMFQELDVNHDQRISKQEFRLYKNLILNKKNLKFDEKLALLFNLFDRNKDNYISRQEIRETMKNLGENLDEKLINEMMQTADTDHDGRISRDEFHKLLYQLHLQ